jgi:hypothetical protein
VQELSLHDVATKYFLADVLTYEFVFQSGSRFGVCKIWDVGSIDGYFVTDLSGRIACHKTLVQTTCRCSVTYQKSKDLVYMTAEA